MYITHLSTKVHFRCVLALIAFVIGLGGFKAVAAQQQFEQGGIQWMRQAIPSSHGIHYDNSQLVLDDAGNAHIFFSGPKDDRDRDLIFYYFPNGDDDPVDILIARHSVWSGVSLFDAVFDSATGELLLLWSDGWGQNLYLSSALVDEAQNPHHWITRSLVPDVIRASLLIDTNGRYHIVYALYRTGVLEYISSSDAGTSWTTPVTLHTLQSTDDSAFSRVRLVLDGDGYLHLTWSESQLNDNDVWQSRLIWYQLLDPSVPDLVIREEVVWNIGRTRAVDYLSVSVGPDGQLIRVWSMGAGSVPGRYQQWSYGGEWSQPEPILDGESGLGGYNYVFWDSQGTSYQLSSGQMPDASGANIQLRLYKQENNRWVLQQELGFSEFCHMALHRGYQVHIACRTGASVIYLVGELPVEPLPDISHPASQPKIIWRPTTDVTNTLASTAAIPIPAQNASSEQPQPIPLPYDRRPPKVEMRAYSAVMISAILVGIFVSIVMAIVRITNTAN